MVTLRVTLKSGLPVSIRERGLVIVDLDCGASDGHYVKHEKVTYLILDEMAVYYQTGGQGHRWQLDCRSHLVQSAIVAPLIWASNNGALHALCM